MEPKAKEFWGKLATGTGLEADDPRYVCREMVRGMDASGGLGRDEIVSTIVRAFNHFADKKKVKAIYDAADAGNAAYERASKDSKASLEILNTANEVIE